MHADSQTRTRGRAERRHDEHEKRRVMPARREDGEAQKAFRNCNARSRDRGGELIEGFGA